MRKENRQQKGCACEESITRFVLVTNRHSLRADPIVPATQGCGSAFMICGSDSSGARAVDPHSLYADPDPAVFLNADPDPGPGLA